MTVLGSAEADGEPVAALARIDSATPRRPDADPAQTYVAGLSTEKGRRAQRTALATIARLLGGDVASLPWWEIRYQHSAALRTKLLEAYAPATVNRHLCALKGVLRESRRLGLMSADDCARSSDLKPAKGERLPAGRALSKAEVKKLFRAAAGDPLAGCRDAAILAILYGSGLRRAELVALDVSNWDAVDGALRVIGKGNKERAVYVAAGRPALDGWLAERGAEPGPLFLPVDRIGRRQPRRLTDHAVLLILKRLATRAGVDSFTPHDCRRTMISDLLDAGADISTVQQLAGHSSVITTQRYDRRGETAKKKAAGLLKM